MKLIRPNAKLLIDNNFSLNGRVSRRRLRVCVLNGLQCVRIRNEPYRHSPVNINSSPSLDDIRQLHMHSWNLFHKFSHNLRANWSARAFQLVCVLIVGEVPNVYNLSFQHACDTCVFAVQIVCWASWSLLSFKFYYIHDIEQKKVEHANGTWLG